MTLAIDELRREKEERRFWLRSMPGSCDSLERRAAGGVLDCSGGAVPLARRRKVDMCGAT